MNVQDTRVTVPEPSIARRRGFGCPGRQAAATIRPGSPRSHRDKLRGGRRGRGPPGAGGGGHSGLSGVVADRPPAGRPSGAPRGPADGGRALGPFEERAIPLAEDARWAGTAPGPSRFREENQNHPRRPPLGPGGTVGDGQDDGPLKTSGRVQMGFRAPQDPREGSWWRWPMVTNGRVQMGFRALEDQEESVPNGTVWIT